MKEEGRTPAYDTNAITRAYYDQILVEMRVIDSVKPVLATRIFGETFSSPIMMPAFSHMDKPGESGLTPMQENAQAAKKLNILNWVGMESDEDYEGIAKVGARTVRIIKPFADHDRIFEQMEQAEKLGAAAVGVDIDHIAGTDGEYDVVDGLPMGPVREEDLRVYAKAATVPFVIKGVLSVRDAEKAARTGCSAIVVSHHHGRIPFGIPPVSVLPKIREALAGTGIAIFCDCSVDDGRDAYKALALGADAVSVGRGILNPLLKGGTKGVVEKVTRMNQELSELMMYTGIPDTSSFDPSVLHIREGARIF